MPPPPSPFCIPLFVRALDINAKMHEGVSGSNMWMDCVVNGVDPRKLILDNCRHNHFVPELVETLEPAGDHMKQRKLQFDVALLQFVQGNTGILLKAMQESILINTANCC